MKRVLFALLSISMALLSCSKSSGEKDIVGDVVFLVGGIESRVSGGSFDQGDAIAVNAYSGSDHVSYTTYSYAGNSQFTSDSPITQSGNSYSYTAIYPNVGDLGDDFSFTVSTDQSSADGVELSDLLVATVASTTSLSPELTFYHSMSNFILNVTVTRDGVSSDEVPTITVHAKTQAQCSITEQSFVAGGESVDITPYSSGGYYSTIIAPQSISAGSVLATMSVSGETFEFKRDLETIFKSGTYLSYDWSVDLVTGSQTITPTGGLIVDWVSGATDDATDGDTSGDANNDATTATFSLSTSQLGDRSVVVGWDRVNDGDGVFDIELFKGSESIRKYDSLTISADDIAQYTSHGWRFVFAGLDPSTQYTAKVTRGSDMGEATFSTTASPDETGYLVCVDFDEHLWGGYPLYNAFGVDYPDASGYLSPTTVVSSSFKGFISSVSEYLKSYFVAWDQSFLNTSYMTEVGLGAGVAVLGTSSEAGKIMLPTISQSTDILLTFDAAPYVEPNATTGSFESLPAVLEGLSFSVNVVSGNTVNDTTPLTNQTPSANGADTNGYVAMTPHSLTITGVTSSTYIYIYTDATSPRMLIDNIKITAK